MKTQGERARLAGTMLAALLIGPVAAGAVEFPGPAPGAAQARIDNDRFVLENNVLMAEWRLSGGRLRPAALVDKLSGSRLAMAGSECFSLILSQSPGAAPGVLPASKMRLETGPQLQQVIASGESRRARDRFNGQRLAMQLVSPDRRLRVHWQAELRDGANALHQRVVITAAGRIEVREVVLLELETPGAAGVEAVEGCPVTAGNLFLACHHPMAANQVLAGDKPGQAKVRCSYPCQRGIECGDRLDYGSVIGVAPAGQMRRGFLYWIERQRAQPYHPFLHHNNGFEVGCEFWRAKRSKDPADGERFMAGQQQLWIDLIDDFARELVEKRKVPVASFVHDHGWDDPDLVWQFHLGYPQGFAPVRAAAERCGARVGVWFSPWGGYSGRALRVAGGQQQFFETYKMGLSMAGPRYEMRLRTACEEMIRRDDVNYFKFDGFAAGNNQPGAGPYRTEAEAMLRIIEGLRRLKPGVFVNATTGTWPSPFWLLWADSIWRQGRDSDVAGKGSDRQQWISYRDAQVLHGTLERSPLYPISSLMIHGVLVTRFPFKGNWLDPKAQVPTLAPKDLADEIRSFFACGVNCQEMYVQTKLMPPAAWDVLAEAALWSRANTDVLADTHWIGGDPLKNEVYGWASWSRRKGILALRNPDDRPARYSLDLKKAFELPEAAPRNYSLKSPWRSDAEKPALPATAGRTQTVELAPFELAVFEATPEP